MCANSCIPFNACASKLMLEGAHLSRYWSLVSLGQWTHIGCSLQIGVYTCMQDMCGFAVRCEQGYTQNVVEGLNELKMEYKLQGLLRSLWCPKVPWHSVTLFLEPGKWLVGSPPPLFPAGIIIRHWKSDRLVRCLKSCFRSNYHNTRNFTVCL